ncbi:RagB/SusD family nutrient uptake outer membrane protein [Flavivirga sp. 57AJ16]|uniref:RagB/SusD family nutrient uptake outer membrane protein n=1 Tax=Flavivirga sp. 57AJ16 TaxID=3025307 RepID=UPI002366686A|nr:RagB/SusD family nutrient uptake outer membrane protein [Flavivirga sp. 57AJ16]MDD7887720.1 RagB/SusD family nutrient uptake outer membrane protein [Flavivirga sp. 57AJ16]
MKKYICISVIIISSILLSCENDYLDVVPDNVAVLDNAFSDRFNAQKFLYTVYRAIPAPGDENNPAISAIDEVWWPESEDWRPGPIIAQGFQSVTSPAYNKWEGRGTGDLYVAIRNSNIFLENIGKVQGMDEYEKNQWRAEVKFLKAYYHFYLLQMYGPIVINNELEPIQDIPDAPAPRRDKIDETFTFIVDLIDEAMEDLPLLLQNESEELGRVTKPIAASIKARILMAQASPLFNGNSVYANFLNENGEPFFPQTYDAEKWQTAATATKEAIDLCHQAGMRLYQKSDYANPFPQSDVTLLKATLRGRVTDKWNPEIIWGSTNDTWGIQNTSIPRLYSYVNSPTNSRHAPTIRMAELYYSKNGIPINEDVTYDYSNRFKVRTADNDDKYLIEIGEETAILNFDRETRFYADLAFDRGVWFGNGKDGTDEDPWYIHGRYGEFASIFNPNQYSVTGYWAKKLVNIETQVTGGNNFSQVRYSFPIIRLADLYLYYAEALNEVKATPDAEVYEYIDLIRERAGLQSVLDSWSASFCNNPTKPLTKSGMREIIQQERMIELSFEGARFWDLRRWKLTKEYMNKPIRGWNVRENLAIDYYTPITLYNPTYSERDYLWPIPENEIIRTPSIIQNPGW